MMTMSGFIPLSQKGGNLVNVVPDEVVIETLVRAANKDAIADAAAKTDRAFKAGAIAVGASCEITTMLGYLPALSEKPMNQFWQPLNCRTKPVKTITRSSRRYPRLQRRFHRWGCTASAAGPYLQHRR